MVQAHDLFKGISAAASKIFTPASLISCQSGGISWLLKWIFLLVVKENDNKDLGKSVSQTPC